MTEETKKKIIEHYQKGQGSIQDLARIYNVSVEEVLNLTGNGDLLEVEFVGDLIDESELNGTGATVNRGARYKQKYSKD